MQPVTRKCWRTADDSGLVTQITRIRHGDGRTPLWHLRHIRRGRKNVSGQIRGGMGHISSVLFNGPERLFFLQRTFGASSLKWYEATHPIVIHNHGQTNEFSGMMPAAKPEAARPLTRYAGTYENACFGPVTIAIIQGASGRAPPADAPREQCQPRCCPQHREDATRSPVIRARHDDSRAGARPDRHLPRTRRCGKPDAPGPESSSRPRANMRGHVF